MVVFFFVVSYSTLGRARLTHLHMSVAEFMPKETFTSGCLLSSLTLLSKHGCAILHS